MGEKMANKKKAKPTSLSLFVNWHSIFNLLAFLLYAFSLVTFLNTYMFPVTTDISALYTGFTFHKDYGVFIFSWNDLQPSYFYLILLAPFIAAGSLSYYYPHRSKRLFFWVFSEPSDSGWRDAFTLSLGWGFHGLIFSLFIILSSAFLTPTYNYDDDAEEIFGEEQIKELAYKIVNDCKRFYPNGILTDTSTDTYISNLGISERWTDEKYRSAFRPDNLGEVFFPLNPEESFHKPLNFICIKNKDVLDKMNKDAKQEYDTFRKNNKCKVVTENIKTRNRFGEKEKTKAFKEWDCPDFYPWVQKSILSGDWSP
tara:strand:+ start:91 stop:1026 length:936 start_codon:yes stop_codon:yes gene_type:complete